MNFFVKLCVRYRLDTKMCFQVSFRYFREVSPNLKKIILAIFCIFLSTFTFCWFQVELGPRELLAARPFPFRLSLSSLSFYDDSDSLRKGLNFSSARFFRALFCPHPFAFLNCLSSMAFWIALLKTVFFMSDGDFA